MTELNVFVPIKKVDVAQRLVYGQLAAEVPDHSGEIMDYETSAPNWKAWSAEIHKATAGKSSGNVRSMHTNIAAGKLTDITFDDATKSIIGCAKIVDDNEWNKVLEGVYTGFSMGGKYVKRWTDSSNPALKRYTASVHEVSLVDSPCIPTAMFFDVVKADGSTEMRKFKVVKDADAELKQVWLAKDGSTFDKKADALQKNIDIAVSAVPDAVANAMDVLQKAQAALASKEAPVEDVEKVVETAVVEPPATEQPVAKAAEAEPAKDADGNIVTEANAKEAAVKAASGNLTKGLCEIAAVVDVIQSLSWLQSDMAWNALFDESNAALAAKAKEILAEVCDFLTSVVADATASLTADKANLSGAQVDALRKFTGNDDLLKDFVELEVKNEPLEKLRAESAEQIEKISHDLELEKAAKATLEKAVGTLTAGIEDMTKRIEHLEAQPMPAKGKASVTVVKGHEGQASGADDAPDEAALAVKFSHLRPEVARAKIAEIKKAHAGQ